MTNQEAAKRYEEFLVYNNPDGTFHILAINRSGGQVIIDRMEDREEADWVAATLNNAIGR